MFSVGQGFDLSATGNAIYLRHDDIQQHQMGKMFGKLGQALPTIFGFDDAIALLPHHMFNQ
jgi:hypothetical protein